MIVVDGVDGSGKGVQTRRLYQALLDSGRQVILTREPGGSSVAEDIRKLLVEGEPDSLDSMTELLLMYAARRSHLDKTIWPALAQKKWVVCDRYADSSRAFQGIAGKLGLETVEKVHQIVVGAFAPALVLILDIPQSIALARALQRGGGEDRFEKKGEGYQTRVREAFLQIAKSDSNQYHIINADQTIDQVTADITDVVNQRFTLNLQANLAIN